MKISRNFKERFRIIIVILLMRVVGILLELLLLINLVIFFIPMLFSDTITYKQSKIHDLWNKQPKK